MKRFIMLAAMAVALCGASSAQRTLTLDECRQLALQNNMSLKNAALKSEMARDTRREAFTKYFPEIGLAGFAFQANHGVVQYDYSTSIPLPSMEIDVDMNFALIKKGIVAGANVVQPVFMGGMIANGNALAEVAAAVAELQVRQSSDQVCLTVEQYFWQLAVLKAKEQTVDDLISLLDTLSNQVNVAVEAGVTLPNDLLQVQIKRNQAASDRVQLKNGINTIASLLGQYIGLGLEPIDINTSIEGYDGVTLPDTLYMAPSDALAQTVDYSLLKRQEQAAKLERRITVGENLPKVAIGAGWFYHDLLEQKHNFGAVYATVAVPISGWWGGAYAIKRSKAKEAIARNELEDYSQLLQIKMSNAWDDLKTAYSQIDIARQTVEESNENLRLNRAYYEAGVSSIDDLLKAQTLMRQARDSYVDAVGQFRISTVKYLQATGR